MVEHAPADFVGAVYDATNIQQPVLAQVADELWNIAVLPRVKAKAAGEGLLTSEERHLLDLLSEVAKGFRAISKPEITGNTVSTTEFDMQEIVALIHALQSRVMSRAAARAYPRDYRQL